MLKNRRVVFGGGAEGGGGCDGVLQRFLGKFRSSEMDLLGWVVIKTYFRVGLERPPSFSEAGEPGSSSCENDGGGQWRMYDVNGFRYD
jgi:hypothetical protein